MIATPTPLLGHPWLVTHPCPFLRSMRHSKIISRCDQDEGIASAPPQHQSRFRLESRVLKAKDDGPPVPLAIFEPPDPTKRPMYAKHLVYQGGTQFNKITDTTLPELNLPTKCPSSPKLLVDLSLVLVGYDLDPWAQF